MALLRSPSTCPLSPIQFHRSSVFPKPFTSKPLVPKIPIFLISETSGSAASPNFLNPKPFLQRLRSSSSSSAEPDSFPSNIIFVKVKILTDKKNKQPLGFAYQWFSGEESAQMAVKEMNGKVCFRSNCEAWILQDQPKGNTIRVVLACFLNDFCSDPSPVATLWSFQYCIRRS